MDVAAALAKGWPDQKWSLNGDDLSGLIWEGEGPPPTAEEVATAWQARQDERASRPKVPTIEQIYNALKARGLLSDDDLK